MQTWLKMKSPALNANYAKEFTKQTNFILNLIGSQITISMISHARMHINNILTKRIIRKTI